MIARPLTWLLIVGLAVWLPSVERSGGWWGLRFLSGFAFTALACSGCTKWAGWGCAPPPWRWGRLPAPV